MTYIAYNLWWHPLAKFPGPKRAAISPFWAMKHWNSGDNLWKMLELHKTYGSVVRIAPNHLSFCSSTSWKDVHGQKPGRKAFLKGTFYRAFPEDPLHIVSVSDPRIHAEMRKDLSHGFSAGALASQEDRIHYFVDLLLEQIGKRYTETPGDMSKWYNYVTFDIIGELAFGEPFGCTESGTLSFFRKDHFGLSSFFVTAGVSHYWIDYLFSGVKLQHFVRSFEYFPLSRSLLRTALKYRVLPQKVSEVRQRREKYTTEKLDRQDQYFYSKVENLTHCHRRLKSPPSRVDFLQRMISKKNDWSGSSLGELKMQAALLTVAGSETTATALCGITYYICRDMQVYQKLVNEIRSAFNSMDEITGRATEHLRYLRAVIEEGLRLYPPIAGGLPRVSPGEVVDGHYIPKGAIVNTNIWVAGHIEQNFHDPLKFLPDRWLDPECKDDKAASQPFSLGTRGCLGRQYVFPYLILWK